MITVGDGDTLEILTGPSSRVLVDLQVSSVPTVAANSWSDAVRAMVQTVPRFWQRDPRWAGHRYNRGLTLGQAGCLVLSILAKAAALGYDTDPVRGSTALREAGCFVGDELLHPSRVAQVFPELRWYGRGEVLVGGETSYINWESRPADVGVLQQVLALCGPTPVKVDFKPQTRAVDQHFVLALVYVPDPTGGTDDDLLVFDPWFGAVGSVLVYRHPLWARGPGQTWVSRALMGARAFAVGAT